jgi:hypothetical protein
MSRVNTTTAKLAPGLGEKMSAIQAHRQQNDEQPRDREGTLNRAGELTGVSGQERGTGGMKNGKRNKIIRVEFRTGLISRRKAISSIDLALAAATATDIAQIGRINSAAVHLRRSASHRLPALALAIFRVEATVRFVQWIACHSIGGKSSGELSSVTIRNPMVGNTFERNW